MNDIILKNIYKSYDGKIVIRDFSYTFKENTITNITGTSGCGKTTLANIIMGLTKIDSGYISKTDARIAAVFQEDRLCEDFSVKSNIALAMKNKNGDLSEAIERLSLTGLEDKKVKNLSGGEKRRVAIARAVLSDFELLILDEAFKGLDDKTKENAIAYIKEHIKNKIVINIAHSEDEIKMLGGSVIHLA